MEDGNGGGERFERFFRPRYPLPEDPPEAPAPRPGRHPASPPPPSPRRRATPSPAQQRLMARIAAGRKARQQRALLVASGLMSALVLLVSGGAWALTGYINGNIGRVDAGTAGTPPSGPLNILVAGVDTRSGLSPHQRNELHVGSDAGANSDTMMIVHLSSDHQRATVVSLPRDTWLNVPGHGMNKINAAYGMGGPKLVVKTVAQATGLPINAYVGVNFLAVVKVVDALGGVDVCVPEAVDDTYSGLNLPAGKSHVNGITALKYARDRHSFANEDLTRIDHQQQLIASLLEEAISGGTLANPVRFTKFLNATLAALQVDRGLSPAALANQLRGIATGDVAFTTVPISNANFQSPDGQSAVLWDTRAADQLFTKLAEDKPLVKPPPSRSAKKPSGPKPSQVTVDVYNATLIGGLSASTGSQLSQRGFHVNAGLTWYRHDLTQTVIEYPPGQEAAARVVHSALRDATLQQKRGLARPRVMLGTGGYALTPAGGSSSGGSGSSSGGSSSDGSSLGGTSPDGSASSGQGAGSSGPVKAKTATQNACG